MTGLWHGFLLQASRVVLDLLFNCLLNSVLFYIIHLSVTSWWPASTGRLWFFANPEVTLFLFADQSAAVQGYQDIVGSKIVDPEAFSCMQGMYFIGDQQEARYIVDFVRVGDVASETKKSCADPIKTFSS